MSVPKGYCPGPLREDETAFILAMHKTMPVKKIAKHLRRGFLTILKHMAVNDLKRYIPGKKRPLKPEEVGYILKNYKHVSVWRMARHLKRDENKVSEFMTKKGLEEFRVRSAAPKESTSQFFDYNQYVY